MMSRVLWLLSLDDEKSTLGRTLETYGRTLPEWVWIPWIPQLLTSLTRRYTTVYIYVIPGRLIYLSIDRSNRWLDAFVSYLSLFSPADPLAAVPWRAVRVCFCSYKSGTYVLCTSRILVCWCLFLVCFKGW